MPTRQQSEEHYKHAIEVIEAAIEGLDNHEAAIIDVKNKIIALEKSNLLLTAHIEDLKCDVEYFKKAIQGNGSNGVLTRLALLEESSKTRIARWTVLATIVAATLAVIGTIVSAYITKH